MDLTPAFAQLHRFYAGLTRVSDAEWAPIGGLFQERVVAKGEVLVTAGAHVDLVGFVVSGIFRGYYLRPSGLRFIRHFYTEGTLVGVLQSAATGRPATHTIDAVETSRILWCRYGDLVSVCGDQMHWLIASRKLFATFYFVKERREQQLLTMNAAERYSAFLADFPAICGRLTQADIAAYIGVTPTSLSRLAAARRSNVKT